MNKNKLIRSLESIIESYDKHQNSLAYPGFSIVRQENQALTALLERAARQ